MRDEHDDRMYQAFRQDLNAAVASLSASIARLFERLTARFYQPSWSETTRALEDTCNTGLKIP